MEDEMQILFSSIWENKHSVSKIFFNSNRRKEKKSCVGEHYKPVICSPLTLPSPLPLLPQPAHKHTSKFLALQFRKKKTHTQM